MDFLEEYFKYENGLTITGLTRELNVFYVLNLFNKENRNILVLTVPVQKIKNVEKYEQILKKIKTFYC